MATTYKTKKPYHICVIDIGSPKLGNIGWCLLDTKNHREYTGDSFDDLIPIIAEVTRHQGLILGLEAPLFVPLRQDILLATKARKGEGRRPWSAGAGAQVLAMNLPIMVYLFRAIKTLSPNITYHLNEQHFDSLAQHIMVFEALVSGEDKGNSHIHDAQIMAQSCLYYAQQLALPPTLLEPEQDTDYFNLVAAALMRSGIDMPSKALEQYLPIYKPRSTTQ